MSRCLSAPDATSLHHCLQKHSKYFTILSEIRALDTKRSVASLGKGDFLGITISFLSSRFSVFPALCWHSQSYASISHTLHTYHRKHISFGSLFLRQYIYISFFSFTSNVTCLPPFFNLNCFLNHSHNVCTLHDKDTKLTSLFLQMSPN